MGWRDRARDPVVRADKAALVEVIEHAPVTDPSVPLFLSLDMELDVLSKERLPFLKRIQQAHPGDLWINLKIANVMSRERNELEAIRYYQAAVSIRPELALGHVNLGKALFRAGRTEEAVVCLRRAVDLDPTSVGRHRLLVSYLSELGWHDEAIARLEKAIRLNPNEPNFRSDLGRILEADGRHAEAIAQLRQAVALQPRNLNFQRQYRDLLPPDSDERPKDLPPARGFGRK
jgi:eukaryotic-like serine/threonine-protein kinase